MEHVSRQADHGKVVNNENDSEVNRLSVFHQAGADPDHTEVKQEDEWHRDGGVDQQPWVSPLVWNMAELCQELLGTIYKSIKYITRHISSYNFRF